MLIVAGPHRMYVASSYIGRCHCENAILVIHLQILITHVINRCKMHYVKWNMVLAFISTMQMHYWADTGLGKTTCIVFMWTDDLWQLNFSNGENNIAGFVWAKSSTICITRWGVHSLICTLHHHIAIIVQHCFKALNTQNAYQVYSGECVSKIMFIPSVFSCYNWDCVLSAYLLPLSLLMIVSTLVLHHIIIII